MKSNTKEFAKDGWTFCAKSNHILKSNGPERQIFEKNLSIPHLPDMVFAQNILQLTSSDSNFSLEFNSLDALKLVDSQNESVQVANSQVWKEARADCEYIGKIVHPFDWTFSTNYCGTLKGNFKVEKTEEEIDLEKLKTKELIHFYADVDLFEDELHDCGSSLLNVKIRVMPGYFFVLLRFYLRVDDVLVRTIESRIFHQFGNNFLLREFSKKESNTSSLKVPFSVVKSPDEVSDHLSLIFKRSEKIFF